MNIVTADFMRWVVSFIFILNVCFAFAKGDDAFIKLDLPTFESDGVFSTTSRPPNDWWVELNDPILDSLINLAVSNNQDVFVAMDNILAARASHRIAQSAFYPTITLERGWAKSKSSRNLSDDTDYISDVTQSNWLFALNASWEIDIFGAIRAKAKEAKFDYEAEIELYNATIMSLTADMASYYAQLRMMQQQLIVAIKNIESQKEILNITEVRFNAGLASQLDVAQAKSVYFNTKASVPILQSSIDNQIYTICQLTGVFPQTLYDWLVVPEEIPSYLKVVAIGTSEEMLANRPDVSAAFIKTKAAKESLNGAKRNFSPQFFVDGSFGFQGQSLNNTFNKNSITYSLSPRISWNFFQGGNLLNSLKQEKANYDAAIRNYNSVVLKATEEVSSAISAYKGRIKQVVSLRELVVQGELMLTLSLDLYKRGLTDFQNVLDAQRSLLEYQNSLVSAEGNSLTALVNLYRSLGF
ncbi:MAG: TolC family protein [Muribaculaceae bacterium]|nr:TolC family protein [Muribaculaceae bacterium]